MISNIEKEIRKTGYNESSSNLRHYCSNWKKNNKSNSYINTLENCTIAKTEPLERKNIFKLLYYPLEKIKSISNEQFEKLLETSLSFKNIYYVLWDFKNLVSQKSTEALTIWMEKTRNLEIKEVNSFLNGIERDMEAVKNAIKYDYSNGLAEGSVNKLKVIKRIMYGRCSFETLKIKTLKLEKMRKIN